MLSDVKRLSREFPKKLRKLPEKIADDSIRHDASVQFRFDSLAVQHAGQRLFVAGTDDRCGDFSIATDDIHGWNSGDAELGGGNTFLVVSARRIVGECEVVCRPAMLQDPRVEWILVIKYIHAENHDPLIAHAVIDLLKAG